MTDRKLTREEQELLQAFNVLGPCRKALFKSALKVATKRAARPKTRITAVLA